MKRFLLLNFIILAIQINAQNDRVSKATLGFGAGNSYYNLDFQNQLNGIKEIIQLQPTMLFITANNIPMTGINFNIPPSEVAHVSFGFNLPKRIMIYDTLSATISGFEYRMHNVKDLFEKKKNVALNISYGFSTGRLKLWDDKRINQKNQFFKAEIGVHPRILIGKFGLSAIVVYGIDISSGKWKKAWFNKSEQISLPNFTQGGFVSMVSIDWIF
jgi:hypothetical protein